MLAILTSLLCLASLWKPIIWATPSNMIPKGTVVNIWCQGSQEAIEYRLFFEGGHFDMKNPQPSHGSMSKVRFIISNVSLHTAGQYSCCYGNGERWSEPSDPLDLMVTGFYDIPSLKVHPGPEVTFGENVSFHCHMNKGTRTFFLLKEGRPNLPQHGYGNIKAEFLVGPMTRAHQGTYRCFGSYNNYLWSFPSNPVKLLVTGDLENITLEPTDPTSSLEYWEPSTTSGFQKDTAFWNHTTQNLIRIGLAFVVLVALTCLFAEEWLSRKRAQEEAKRVSCKLGIQEKVENAVVP